MHLLSARPISSGEQTSGPFPASGWWIFVLSVRCFEPYNIKPPTLIQHLCMLWSIVSSQDSEWSIDWTTSGIWMLNNCPLNRGDSCIMHQPAESPISFGPSQAMLSHSDLSREQKVKAQIVGTPSSSMRQCYLAQGWEDAKNNGVEAERVASEGWEQVEEIWHVFKAKLILRRFVCSTFNNTVCWDGRDNCNVVQAI